LSGKTRLLQHLIIQTAAALLDDLGIISKQESNMTTEQVLELVRKLNKALEQQSPNRRIPIEFVAVLSLSEDQINLGPFKLNDFDTDEETEESAIWEINDKLNDLKYSIDAAKSVVGCLMDQLPKVKGKRKLDSNQKKGQIPPKFFQEKQG